MPTPLSSLDTLFVTLDDDRFPMHGGGVMVFDRSTPGGPLTIENVVAHVKAFLPAMPPMTRRLLEVPLGLATPIWVEDPAFDLTAHVHHVAVPDPGDDRALARLVDEIGSLPLAWDRPLWDLWFIEGLANDKVAIFIRMHHCAIDGMGGLEMIFQMFTLDAGDVAAGAPIRSRASEPLPSPARMLVGALPSLAAQPFRGAKAVAELAVGMTKGRAHRREAGDAARGAPLFSGPRLPFNEVPDGAPHKSTAWFSLPMADVKAIRARHDCTVNDVALALTTGALRTWLGEHDALPAGPITCGNPLNIRSADASGQFENQFAIFSLNLPTHLADPAERIRTITAATAAAKGATRGYSANLVDSLVQVLSPGLAELVVSGAALGLGKRYPAPYNTLVTNLQGPPIPLYFAGARLDAMHIQMMQARGMSLIFALITYAGQMHITMTGHRENTPDIWQLVDAMRDEVDELLGHRQR